MALCHDNSNYQTKEKILYNLQALSSYEKRELNALFRDLFLNDGFAYTLFDERALAFTAYFKREPLCNIISGRNRSPPVASWWKTWEKYKHLFPMRRFALIATQDRVHNSVNLYLVNKKLYFDMLHEASSQSRWVRNSGKTLEELQEIFTHFKIEKLPNYIEVLGILLGYGENNAYLFYRRDQIEQLLMEGPPPYKNQMTVEVVKNLREEIDRINKSLIPIRSLMKTQTHVKRLCFLSFVGFLVDATTDETKKILVKFQASKKKITDEYSRGDFLEITLEQLVL